MKMGRSITGVNEEDPGGMAPGSLVVWSSVGLGDGLEGAVLEGVGEWLNDRNRSTDYLGD